MFDYFYDLEAEQFSFYRVPKVMFTEEMYSALSVEAKILYGILLDRVGLSLKNGWKDESKRIYIVFPIEEILKCLRCSNKKAVKLMAELEEKGLIEKKRQGLGKPNVIYVKNFIKTVDNSHDVHFKKCKNDTSGSVESTPQEVSEVHANNTERKKTYSNETELSIHPADAMDGYRLYEKWFKKTMEFDHLVEENPTKTDLLQGILDLLVETCCSKRALVRIAGQDMPTEVVKNRLMKLKEEHIRYVLNSLKQNTTDVRNIRQYILTALYNAPVTMSAYYQAKVNHDMYAPKEEEIYAAVNSYGYY